MNRYVGGNPSVWRAARWRRLGGELSESGGGGDTPEDVVGFPDIPIEEISAYHDAVRAETRDVFDALSEADLGKRFDERGRGFGKPPPVAAWVLGHIVVEATQHVGQVAFVRGMMRVMNQ